MPTVRYGDRNVDCERGAVLRNVPIGADIVPHNGNAKHTNCRGHGTCGTCAVAVEGETSEPTRRERWRLDFPPHDVPWLLGPARRPAAGDRRRVTPETDSQ